MCFILIGLSPAPTCIPIKQRKKVTVQHRGLDFFHFLGHEGIGKRSLFKRSDEKNPGLHLLHRRHRKLEKNKLAECHDLDDWERTQFSVPSLVHETGKSA